MVSRPSPNSGRDDTITLRQTRMVGRTGPSHRAWPQQAPISQSPATRIDAGDRRDTGPIADREPDAGRQHRQVAGEGDRGQGHTAGAVEGGAVGPAEILQAAIDGDRQKGLALAGGLRNRKGGHQGEIKADDRQPYTQHLAEQAQCVHRRHGDLADQIGAAAELGEQRRELAGGQREHQEAELVRAEAAREQGQDHKSQQLVGQLRRHGQCQIDAEHPALHRAGARCERRAGAVAPGAS